MGTFFGKLYLGKSTNIFVYDKGSLFIGINFLGLIQLNKLQYLVVAIHIYRYI